MLTWLLLPAALALPSEVARRALRPSIPEGLVLQAREIPWAGGTVVRFRQTLGGLPVLDAGPRVSLDRTDKLLRMRGEPLVDLPDTLSPSLLPDAAALTAQDALFIDPSEGLWPPRARLAVDPSDGAHLVWVVDISRAHPLQTWQVWVDAVDGTVRHAEATTHTVDGTVFPESPAHSDPEVVELENLRSSERLAGIYAEAFSCVEWDIDPRPFGQRDCLAIDPTATPDDKGNYRHEPAYGALEDPFAEVHAYHHTDRISSWADTLWGVRLDGPIRILTNFPLTNAFYGDFDGDGTRDVSYGISDDGLNFAYDSDVVYHEYGHAIVRTVAGSMGMSADEIGIDWTSGALNEGTADLFAMVLNEDPLLAEYLGQSDRWDQAIRDLEPDRRCPDDLQSQVHRSGEIFGALGWNLIEVMGPDLTAELLMGALSTWSNQTSWADAGESLLNAAQDLHSAGEIPAATLEAAQARIHASGMPDCSRIIDLASTDVSRQYLLNLGLDGDYARFPTGVQFSLLAPTEATGLQLEILDFDGKKDGTGWTVYVRAGEPVGHLSTRVEGVGLAYAEATEFDLQVDGESAAAVIRIDEDSPLQLVPGEIYYFAIASRNQTRTPMDVDYATITVAGRVTIGHQVDEREVSAGGCHTGGSSLPPGWLILAPLFLTSRRRQPPRPKNR